MATTTPTKYLGADILPLIKTKVDAKQDELVSGTNIKTVNNESVLGTGNIDIPAAKLYGTYGTNEDGALTQKFASEQLQELESYAEKTVQTDTKLGEDLSSTVTIVKTTGALDSDTTTDTEVPLPIASDTQAGILNPALYNSIQESANQIGVILKGSVSIDNLAADADQDALTAAWKTATGLTELINGARIYDKANSKIWTYYSNTAAWESADVNAPEIEISTFTNTQAGIIKGADVDGKVYAETDGTGSVKGWDTLKASVSTNTSAVSALQTGKQDTLVGEGDGQNLKTINEVSLLGAGNIDLPVPEAMTAEEFNDIWDAA